MVVLELGHGGGGEVVLPLLVWNGGVSGKGGVAGGDVEWWGGRRFGAVWVCSWLWGFGPGVLERARCVDTPC
jgi:hypothetical protein